MNPWIVSLRLRTLPLAIAIIAVGGALAYIDGFWDSRIWLLTVLTTILLQILSNLANEYGDFEKGTDNADRLGPIRSMQQGSISKKAMLDALVICGLLAFVSGLTLISIALSGMSFWVFLAFGILSIIGAVMYTMSDAAYGYKGLGDFAVFIFFGLLAIGGSYYLLAGSINPHIWLPATTMGAFSTAVLNINNIRDMENDRASGKITIPIRLGEQGAIIYHFILLLGGILASVAFTYMNFRHPIQWTFLLILPLAAKSAIGVVKFASQRALDPYLKQMVITTLLFAILFCTGLILSESLAQ